MAARSSPACARAPRDWSKLRARTGAGAFDLALEARGLVLDLIERHAIDSTSGSTGHLAGAVNGSDLRDLEEEAECLASVMDFMTSRCFSGAGA